MPENTADDAPAAAGGTDLMSLLAEFERETGGLATASTPAPAKSDNPADPGAAPSLDELMQEIGHDQAPQNASAELREKIDTISTAVSAMQAERRLEREKSDFANIVKMATDSIAEFSHLPADFAERWLTAEAVKDQKLRAAFDNRYSSPQAYSFAQSQVRKAIERLYKAAKSLPDIEATEDRALVTAMMRGASKAMPAPRPVRYGDMTDVEFNRHVKETYGYDPVR